MIHPKRIYNLIPKPLTTPSGPVVYWMSRDMRVQDNWALWYAYQIALSSKQPLIVIFNLLPSFNNAGSRQYRFLLQGLQECEYRLANLSIPFTILEGDPEYTIPEFIHQYRASHLISDFSPLRQPIQWKTAVSKRIHCQFDIIDTHNIIPVWETSDKLEFAARTIRPKIRSKLAEWLVENPSISSPLPYSNQLSIPSIHWDRLFQMYTQKTENYPITWIQPGEKAAQRILRHFLNTKIQSYTEDRNHPNRDGLSNLSPYLHFGHISAQRVAWEIINSLHYTFDEQLPAFLEELIIRKELSDNFCYYQPHYDSFQGFPQWAQTTLDHHRKDTRSYLYTRSELEYSKTHDPLWNAAQKEMVITGKMHGYIRMYWAKKILEWTPSPEDALAETIYLNDTYELDGRDPIGYTNIAWSIGGVHDHGWTERPIFGKIRYMSLGSTGKKFNSQEYIQSIETLSHK